MFQKSFFQKAVFTFRFYDLEAYEAKVAQKRAKLQINEPIEDTGKEIIVNLHLVALCYALQGHFLFLMMKTISVNSMPR